MISLLEGLAAERPSDLLDDLRENLHKLNCGGRSYLFEPIPMERMWEWPQEPIEVKAAAAAALQHAFQHGERLDATAEKLAIALQDAGFLSTNRRSTKSRAGYTSRAIRKWREAILRGGTGRDFKFFFSFYAWLAVQLRDLSPAEAIALVAEAARSLAEQPHFGKRGL